MGQIVSYAHGREILKHLWPDLKFTPETLDEIADHIAAFSYAALKTFGRPTRVTACQCERISEPNVAQVLKVMNSPSIQAKLSHADGTVARWSRSAKSTPELLDEIYLTFLSRFPDDAERTAASDYLNRHAERKREALEDLAWSLMNTTEFVFQH